MGLFGTAIFPLNEDAFRIHLNDLLDVVNRLGQASVVMKWLAISSGKPRLSRALTFELMSDCRMEEFVLGTDR